jgi:hypothetical protein
MGVNGSVYSDLGFPISIMERFSMNENRGGISLTPTIVVKSYINYSHDFEIKFLFLVNHV